MKFLKNLATWVVKHKIAAAVLAVVVVGGGYRYVSTRAVDNGSTYTIGSVTKDTIVQSVAGTGQVAVTNQ